MIVTNLGHRKWKIDGVLLRHGQPVRVSEDSWRLALDCNKALRLAASEFAVEEEASPVAETAPPTAPPALAAPPPSHPADSDDEGRSPERARKRKAKR